MEGDSSHYLREGERAVLVLTSLGYDVQLRSLLTRQKIASSAN